MTSVLPRAPRGPIHAPLLYLAGLWLGLASGIVLYTAIWVAAHPGMGLTEAIAHARSVSWTEDPLPLFLLAGSVLGILLTRVYEDRRPRRMRAAAGARRRHTFLKAGAWGATGGLLFHLVLWSFSHPEQGLLATLFGIPAALVSPDQPLLIFILAGTMVGLGLAIYVVGGNSAKRAAQTVSSTMLGGTAGLVTYCIAYVVTNYPRAPRFSEYLFRIAEAIYSATPVEFFLVGLGAIIGALMGKYSWRTYGVFTLVSLVSSVLGYLLYTLAITLPAVQPDQRWLSYFLFAAESFSLGMVVLYSFYTLDVATRKRWSRAPDTARFSKYYMPKVAFQVPMYNEPVDMVLDTLRSLAKQDYPRDRYVVMVLDDSSDPAHARPIEAFCHANDFVYIHRPVRGGFKAGALNYAIPRTPDDVDLVAIIDADYQVEPNFLTECVGYFTDRKLGWVQTPQDYRNNDQSFLTRQYAMADAYFYRTILPSRNEENSIIFCGTMGILRQRALVDSGGWGEKYITEDAELSVRLINLGYDSFYINKTYGRGLIPPTFEGYKKQHYRWAFGGAKILKGHFWDILFKRFTGRQKFDYFIGSLHWFEGLFVIGIALAVLMMGLGELLGFDILTHHSGEIMLLGLVPFFILIDGMTRLHMVLRRVVGPGVGSTVRILGMWFSVKFSNTFAATKAVLGISIPFVRTQKAPLARVSRREALSRTMQLTMFETTMSAILFVTGFLLLLKTYGLGDVPVLERITRTFLVFWLLYYALIFFAAPLYAYKSYVTFTPDTDYNAMRTQVTAVGAPQ